jgi:hypothetical protein
MLRVVLILLALGLALSAREFDPRRDALAFSNDTAMKYTVDAEGRLHVEGRKTPANLAHRCFLFSRSVMQFWNFARFEPRQRRVSDDEYRKLLRSLFRIPVWSTRTERIVFPGYRNLWDFSHARAKLVQEELGSWILTYLRVGNWRMANPLVRLFQRSIAEKLFAGVSQGHLRAMYLAKFPHMNHVVVVYAAQRLPDGRIRFRVYDANYAGQSARLDYLPDRNIFDFERRFYWPGGELRAFPVFTSPFH